ncbi:MAG: DUF1684 domain-containing protein [Anaerolineales bacterium]
MNTLLSAGYKQGLEQFRVEREANLRREYGWLSLAGLFWLKEGKNTFGSEAGHAIRLPARAPVQAGEFTLRAGQVTVTCADGVPLRLNEKKLADQSPTLKADTSGQTDFMFLEDIRMALIQRGGELAIRVWDPQNLVRLGFSGCAWYQPDARFRVTARIKTYAEPKQVVIEDVIGFQRPAEMQAALEFSLDGKELSLDAELLEDGSYDLIFKDDTAGKTTYSAGRYLTTHVAEGSQVVIDFNYAYDPPCAYTEFATCPLPLAQNVLPVPIGAGEQYLGGGHV